MARIRRNILSMPLADVKRLTAAFNVLKADGTYDDFAKRHVQAMNTPTPAGSTRNVAHRAPSFLPWHRAFTLEMEDALIAVDPAIQGLPYWKWHEEASRNGGDARKSRLWTADYLGGDGDPARGDRVLDGPFGQWRALVYNNSTGTFTPRGTVGLVRRLQRDPNGQVSALPDLGQVSYSIEGFPTYDAAPWDATVTGFRNRVEGWLAGPRMHNTVHRWVGGDMLAGTSPNDPVFGLHHAAVDRIWWLWQQRNGVNTYQPVSGGPAGHNLDDELRFLKTPRTPASLLDIAQLGYSYV